MTDTLTIRLICLYPPPGDYGGTPAAFGLQTRTGGLIAGSWRDDGALVFEFTVGLSRARDGLRFGGTAGIDVVQGRRSKMSNRSPTAMPTGATAPAPRRRRLALSR